MQRVMMTFEKQGDMMELKQELMDDTIDDVMEQEGDDEAEEQLLMQVSNPRRKECSNSPLITLFIR